MSIDKTLAQLRERISGPNFPPEKLNGELSNGLDDLILGLSPIWREISQIVTPLRPLAMEAILREAVRSEERSDDIRAIHGYKQVLVGSLLRLERLLLASSQRSKTSESGDSDSLGVAP